MRTSAHTRPGTRSRLNQDSILCRAPDAFAVADGVGGGAHGELASSLLVGHCANWRPRTAGEDPEQMLRRADAEITAILAQAGGGPGAAVLCALWRPDQSPGHWIAAWVGDCRLLHLRRSRGKWTLAWSSTDQTYASLGLRPPPGVAMQAPANMVGAGMSAVAGVTTLHLHRGDRIVLCSDGLHGVLGSQALCDAMNASPPRLAPELAQELCDRAQALGSEDDVSAVIVEVGPRIPLIASLATAAAGLAIAAAGLLGWLLMRG